MKRIIAIFSVLIFLALAGCDGRIDTDTAGPRIAPPADTPVTAITPLPASDIDAAGSDSEKDGEYDDRVGEIPLLSACADDAASFVPGEWSLLDSVEPDYNTDGLMDMIGVLEHPSDADGRWYPRILFAARQTTDGGYALDFQDINLVRGAREGGVWGDPYLPLTAEGNTFTINAYGGSAWKWSESTTFEYRNGDWYLAQERHRYGYGSITTSVTYNDYRTGMGIRQLNNDDFDTLSVLSDESDEERFELEYAVKLDPAPSLYEAGLRWWLAWKRLTEIPVREITIREHIELEKADVPIWVDTDSAFEIRYTDKNYILYTFRKAENVYLAVYNRQSQIVNVIAQANRNRDVGYLLSGRFESLEIYRDKIYYREEDRGLVKLMKDGGITEVDATLSTRVVRMNLDGSDTEVLFRYDNHYTEGEISETYLPHISVIPYLSGGELIVSFSVGNTPDRYYRMDLDGSNVQLIGELKGFSD